MAVRSQKTDIVGAGRGRVVPCRSAGKRVRSAAPDPVGEAMAEEIDRLLFELTQQVLATLIELTKRAKERFQSKDELDLFSTPFSLLADRAFALLAASDYMAEAVEEG